MHSFAELCIIRKCARHHRHRRLHGSGNAGPGARPPRARARRPRLRLPRRPPPSALDVRLNGHLPSFVSNAEALASGADAPALAASGPTRPPCWSRRRTPSSSISRAGTGSPIRRSTRPGTASSTRGRRLSETGATRCPSCGRRPGADRQPRLLRDRRAARARAAHSAIEPAGVIVDAKSGVSGAGRALKEASHAGLVLENLTPYRVGSHQHAPEIAQALGFPVCFVPHLLPVRRGLLVTCYVQPLERRPARAAGGRVRGRARRPRPPRRRRSGARARPGHRRRGAGRLRGPGHRPDDHRLRPRQPRQGRRRTGDTEREPRARPRGDRRAAPRGRAGMSVTSPRGFVASGVHCGIRKTQPDLAIVRATGPADGSRDVHGQPGQGRTCGHLAGASRARRSRRRSSSTPASRTRPPGSAVSWTRGRPPARRRGCSGSTPRRCSSSRPA